jgi:hypothetical protein
MPVASAAARRRRREISEIGIARGDIRTVAFVAADLAMRGRRREAVSLLRVLESRPRHVRYLFADVEYLARCAAGRQRAARHWARAMGRLGYHWLKSEAKLLESLVKDDPDSARAFVLMDLKGLAIWW